MKQLVLVSENRLSKASIGGLILKFLLLSEEKKFSFYLENELSESGFRLTTVNSKHQMDYYIELKDYDYLILCYSVFDMDKLSICKDIREKRKISTLVYTATIQEELKKILDNMQISVISNSIPMIGNMMKSQSSLFANNDSCIKLLNNEIEIDFNKQIIKKGNELTELSRREAELLKLFVANKGKIVRTDYIIDNIWSGVGSETNVYITIKKIRKKIELNPEIPKFLITKKGGGFLFDF